MGEVWRTAHVTELCLHSLPAQRLETEMNIAPTNYRVVTKICRPRTTFSFTFTPTNVTFDTPAVVGIT